MINKFSERVEILVGGVFERLRDIPDNSIDCVTTSPPYWGLRSYLPDGHDDKGKEIGLERSLGEHLEVMVAVFRDVRRVLKPTGVCWINYGDCYATAPNGRSAADTKALTDDDRTFRDKPFSTVGAVYSPNHGGEPRGQFKSGGRQSRVETSGRVVAVFDPDYRSSTSKQRNRQHGTAAQGGRVVAGSGGYLKPKDLCLVPQRLFIALQDDGWWVRSVLPWVKRNGMPESITDRPANSLEYVAMLTKSERYWYDPVAVRKASSGNTNARVSGSGSSSTGRPPGVTGKSADHVSGNGVGRVRANDSWHQATAGNTISDRNFRNTDLFFSSIEEPWGLISGADGMPLAIDANPAGFSEAHFATFPPALIEPLVRGGTSERGCCRHCGAPWSRVTVDVDTGARQKIPDGMATYAGSHSAVHRDGREAGAGDNPVTTKETVGWYPDCSCDGLRKLPAYPAKPGRAAAASEAEYKRNLKGWRVACAVVDRCRRVECSEVGAVRTVPARVLDPFGGAGTTGLVAASLGRQCTLIELNPEYAILARARIEAAFMGKEEGQRHMVKQLGKLDVGAGPLFDAIG